MDTYASGYSAWNDGRKYAVSYQVNQDNEPVLGAQYTALVGTVLFQFRIIKVQSKRFGFYDIIAETVTAPGTVTTTSEDLDRTADSRSFTRCDEW